MFHNLIVQFSVGGYLEHFEIFSFLHMRRHLFGTIMFLFPCFLHSLHPGNWIRRELGVKQWDWHVYFMKDQKPNTILINTSDRRLGFTFIIHEWFQGCRSICNFRACRFGLEQNRSVLWAVNSACLDLPSTLIPWREAL
jgi:hypothetical protein